MSRSTGTTVSRCGHIEAPPRTERILSRSDENGSLLDAPQLRWSEDNSYFHLGDFCFAVVPMQASNLALTPGQNCFGFHKGRALVEEYLDFFRQHSPAGCNNIVELGLFDGGSIPFWFELLQPAKHVGIDIRDRRDESYFQDYVKSRGAADRIETHWKTDQADSQRLRAICDKAFNDEPIDLVIDDASHWYAETLASFEALFPRLRTGGVYIIEDWAWLHWKELEGVWEDKEPLTPLIVELLESIGSNRAVIEQMVIRGGFVAVRRGPGVMDDTPAFHLADYIYRHPRQRGHRLDFLRRRGRS